MNRQYRIVLTDPGGLEWDLTSRASQLAPISEEIEDELLHLVHSDLDLELNDSDGEMTRLFTGVLPGDVFTVSIEREVLGARRGKWERIFAGMADLPFSVSFDLKDQVCQFRVFSFTKLLEYASAESYKRSITGRTGTVSAGSRTVTMNDTTGFAPNDKITLTSSSASEQQTIATINSATQVSVKTAFSSAFSSAPVTLDTPYYRGETVANLARTLFGMAGITDVTVQLSPAISDRPFPSPINTSGLGTGAPTTILESAAAAISVYKGGHRFTASDATSAFTDSGTDTAKQDWHPYLTSCPGTLQPYIAGRIYDYTDAAHPYYSLLIKDTGTEFELWLQKNGADLVKVDSVNYATSDGDYLFTSFEVACSWGEIWVSFAKIYQVMGKDRWGCGTKRYNSSGTLLGSLNNMAGGLRFVRAADRMAIEVKYQHTVQQIDPEVDQPQIRLYSGGSYSLTLESAPDLQMDTFRKVGNFFACIRGGSKTYTVLWDTATGTKLADYQIADMAPGTAVATTFNDGGAIIPEYIAYAGGTWFCLSVRAAGVIPYADFEGMSVGEALKQIALITASVLEVNHEKEGRLVARSLNRREGDLQEIAGEESATLKPVWESYRTSVSVKGKDEFGAEFDEIAGGITGDSARRLEVELDLPVNSGLAGALARGYLDWFGQARREGEIVIEEPERLVRMFDAVFWRDGFFRVTKAESNLDEEQQDLTLAEEVT